MNPDEINTKSDSHFIDIPKNEKRSKKRFSVFIAIIFIIILLVLIGLSVMWLGSDETETDKTNGGAQPNSVQTEN